MLKKNQKIELLIDGMSHDGNGVGHFDGMAVFVPHAAIGDRLSVHITKVNKTHAFGKLHQVITASPDRIKPDCPVCRRCGGCRLRHVTYEAELRYKEAFVQSNLARIGKFELPAEPIVPSPLADEYRNKAQYPVRMQDGRAVTGFFAPRTHEVIPHTACRLQPPSFQLILEAVLGFIDDLQIPVYDELSHTGLVRHIYIRRAWETGQMMVCLVLNGDSLPHQKELLRRLEQLPCDIRSVYLNFNRQNTNVILGDENRLIFGSAEIYDVLCGVRLPISPLSFYQVNSPATQRLYSLAAEYAGLTGSETLVDLYCGIGSIGLSMAGQCAQLIGVEVVAQAVEDARRAARENQIENARFIAADAGEAAQQLLAEGVCPDVVILDPPRKGCDHAVLDALKKMAPQRIVYISCNSATMARDCALLREAGYRMERCRPVDLFPRTPHIETVVLLSRKIPNDVIHVDLELDEMDVTSAEAKATYQEIKDYVLDKFGFKVSQLYIAQVKRKHGIIERENYNVGEGKTKVPQCPPEKEAAILDALRQFSMIGA